MLGFVSTQIHSIITSHNHWISWLYFVFGIEISLKGISNMKNSIVHVTYTKQ